jgi:hypothetical protein
MLIGIFSFILCRFFKEMLCSLITGMLGMPLGIMQFLPIYHPLHDSLHIHAEVCVLLFLGVLFLITWASDRRPSNTARSASAKGNTIGCVSRIIFCLNMVLMTMPVHVLFVASWIEFVRQSLTGLNWRTSAWVYVSVMNYELHFGSCPITQLLQ